MNLGKAGEAYVELIARLDRYERGLAKAKAATASAATEIEQAATQKIAKGFDRAGVSAEVLLGRITKLSKAFGVVTGAAGVVKLIQIADAYQLMGRRIGIALGDVENFSAAQQRLFEIAQRTGGSLGALGDLTARIGPAAQQAGRSTEELFRVVETLSKILAVSGTSAAEAEGAIRQLAQALGSGFLSGDEFRSVAEQMPALLDLVSAALGKTRAELRQLGSEGKLSTQLLFDVLLQGSAEIDKRFEQTGNAVSRSFQRVLNSFQQLIGEFLSGTGIIDGLALALDTLASGLDVVTGAIRTVIDNWKEALEAFANRPSITLADDIRIAMKQAEIVRLSGMIDQERAGLGILGDEEARAQRIEGLTKQIAKAREELKAMIDAGLRAEEAAAAAGAAPPAGVVRPSLVPGEGPPRSGAAAAPVDLASLQLRAREPTGQPRFSQRIEEQMRRALALTEQYETAQQRLARRQAELADLYSKGFIDLNTLTRAQAAAQREALEQGASELVEYGDAWDGVRASVLRYQAAARDTARIAADLTEMGLEGLERGLGGIGAMLVQGKTSWAEFGEAAQKALGDIVSQLVQVAVRAAIIAPLLEAFGGGGLLSGGAGGSIFGGAGVGGDLLAGRGLAFDGGALVRMGRGGIVRAPTRFRFARGGAIGGELGTEGILPLKRDRSGNLGVSATGAAPRVEFHVHNEHPGAVVQTRQEQGPDGEIRLRAYIREVTGREIARGALREPMRQEFGVRPALMSRA